VIFQFLCLILDTTYRPYSSTVPQALGHRRDPDVTTTAGPASHQTSLLIAGATVCTIFIVVFTLVLVLIGRASMNRRQQYSVHKISFPYEEDKVGSEIYTTII